MKTMRCFVSSCAIDQHPARELVRAIREVAIVVEHSPVPPDSGGDSRWKNWYQSGCSETIAKCDALVIVVDRAWDSSTWMAHESWCAMQDPKRPKTPMCFYWDPGDVRPKAPGMIQYLKERLPSDPVLAARLLESRMRNG
jgi:hypothetical protein